MKGISEQQIGRKNLTEFGGAWIEDFVVHEPGVGEITLREPDSCLVSLLCQQTLFRKPISLILEPSGNKKVQIEFSWL